MDGTEEAGRGNGGYGALESWKAVVLAFQLASAARVDAKDAAFECPLVFNFLRVSLVQPIDQVAKDSGEFVDEGNGQERGQTEQRVLDERFARRWTHGGSTAAVGRNQRSGRVF